MAPHWLDSRRCRALGKPVRSRLSGSNRGFSMLRHALT